MNQSEWDGLLAKQKQLEESAYAEGAARFRRRLEQATQKGAASTVGGAHKLLKHGLEKMEKAINVMMSPAGTRKQRGPRHAAAKWCEAVGSDVAAYITLKVVLDGIGKKGKLHDIARTITTLILDELRYRRFQEQAPHLFEYKLKSFHTSSYAHMARSLNASMTFATIDISDLKVPPSQLLLIGIKLIDILIACTGLVEVKKTKDWSRRTYGRKLWLIPTAETQQWIKADNAATELWQAVVMPMVVPPLKWNKGIKGGFRYELRDRHVVVRRSTEEKRIVYEHTDMPIVYEALNTLQNTAWKINSRVLSTVQDIIGFGGGIAGIPKSDDEPDPAKPHDIAENEQARKAWRTLSSATKERNAIRRQQAVSVRKTLSTALAVVQEKAIYFPCSLDFRGRVYPIATYLTPQGDDLSRAFLTFADGKLVDTDGVRWLAIHGANCVGETPEGAKVSKLSMEERYEWIIKNSGRILAAADAPTRDLWWTKADEPLQFLAFCFEWANLIRANDRGEKYVCSLPCSMDGSCNGLQHFSALFCDEVGGTSVNIVPQETPQDIYSIISDAALTKLEEAAAVGDKVASLWLGLHRKTGIINRKLAKRPTMTFGYGSKQFGFKKQIADYLRALPDGRDIRAHFLSISLEGKEKSQFGTACSVMSRVIWEALHDVVVSAFDGMKWMQTATRGISKKNRPVTWTVPMTGFPVTQEYYHVKKHRITTLLAGSVIRPSVYTTTPDVNRVKQANAVAPNFIHSLDAAALMLTVVNALAEGVEQFAMVHDSYGTVPSDCSLLARCCRQSFAKLYMQQDVAAGLHAELAAQWDDPAKCPAAPSRGTLDVSQVLASTYFFA